MMKYFQWAILSSLTGRHILSLVILVVFWWSADRLTFRFLPDPFRFMGRWNRMRHLRRMMQLNPHDRRSRFELGDLLIQHKRYAAAVDVLKPNLEEDHDDAATLYLMGLACFGSQRADQGEVFMEAARAIDPGYRMHAIDLELGRWRLDRGDAAKARVALERFLEHRRGSVEGQVLLSKALELLGEKETAAKRREIAWAEYASSPGFQQRVERKWAWRARPSRPITYGALLLVGMLIFGRFVAPPLKAWAEQSRSNDWSQYDDE